MNLKELLIYTGLIGGLILGKAQGKDMEEKLNSPIETIEHISGEKFSWNAFVNEDYFPRTNSILDKLETEESKVVSGGFEKNPDLLSSLGTFSEVSAKSEVDSLIEKYKNQITHDKKLISSVKEVAADKSSFYIIEDFLKNGGKIEAWPSGGHYSSNPLIISIGTNKKELGIQKTSFHEFLHYAFDKIDSILHECPSGMGADHLAIYPLEERFEIIQQIRKGQMPINKDYTPCLYGFTTDGKLGEKIKKCIKEKDIGELSSLINSDDFYRGYVRAGMTMPLGSNAWGKEHPEEKNHYNLSQNEIEDIAFLNAINAAIIQQSFNLAMDISQKSNKNIKDSFKSADFQKDFNRFIKNYSKILKNPSKQPYKAAQKARILE